MEGNNGQWDLPQIKNKKKKQKKIFIRAGKSHSCFAHHGVRREQVDLLHHSPVFK
jgi:hypothetical protein